MGTDWEQDWGHWEQLHLNQPFDTAIRAVPLKPEVGDTVQSQERMLQLSLEQQYEQADYRETSPFEHPTRDGQIEVPSP